MTHRVSTAQGIQLVWPVGDPVGVAAAQGREARVKGIIDGGDRSDNDVFWKDTAETLTHGLGRRSFGATRHALPEFFGDI